MSVYSEGETYSHIPLSETPLPKGEYENCTFEHCDFSSADLSDFRFVDCTFTECNLSLIKTRGTSFRDVQFKNCKMLGVRFDECNPLGIGLSFDGCQLTHSSFFKLSLKNTHFVHSILDEADFSSCDLTGSLFDHSRLAGTVFSRTNLQKCDFRLATAFDIDTATNQLKKAKFTLGGLPGLLTGLNLVIENRI